MMSMPSIRQFVLNIALPECIYYYLTVTEKALDQELGPEEFDWTRIDMPINIASTEAIRAIVSWLNDICGNKWRWEVYPYDGSRVDTSGESDSAVRIYFEDGSHAVLFKLRWC